MTDELCGLSREILQTLKSGMEMYWDEWYAWQEESTDPVVSTFVRRCKEARAWLEEIDPYG